MTAAQRLNDALGRAGWTVYRLAGEFQRQRDAGNGVRGASESSIRNYLKGRSEPRLEFLLAAADILDEDPDWLVRGGPRVEMEAEGVRALQAADELFTDDVWVGTSHYRGGRYSLSDLAASVAKELGVARPRGVPVWAPVLVEPWAQIAGPGSERDSALAIGRALRAGLDAYKIDASGLERRGRLGSYIMTMVPMLLTLGTHRREAWGDG